MNIKRLPTPDPVHLRGTGRTTRAIKGAPTGAIFMCEHERACRVIKGTAKDLGRSDLTIVGPLWLEDHWYGSRAPAIVLDHAVCLSERQRRLLTMVEVSVTASWESGK